MIRVCRDRNIYTDVSPYWETAVIISDKKREEAIKGLDYDSYINASFIKTAFKESSKDQEEPFGLIIAT